MTPTYPEEPHSDDEPLVADLPVEAGEGWSADEIEAAYRRALEGSDELPEEDDAAPVEDVAEVVPLENASPETKPSSTPATVRDETPIVQSTMAADTSAVSPRQVVEAALFVGGTPLTARRICGLLWGDYDIPYVERTIDELNQMYVEQNRPYEIRLGEGGYRLELRPDYERYRQRVFGVGPREVKLSQDLLEVLAVVAYRQPVSLADFEKLGKRDAGNHLRQLLRRDLLTLTRGPGGPKDVTYSTAPRFLSVFGLAGLEDLPQVEDIETK